MYTSETPNFSTPYTNYQLNSYDSGPSPSIIIIGVLFGSVILITFISICFYAGPSKNRSTPRGTGQGLNTYNPGTTYHDWGIDQNALGHYAGHHNSHTHDHHGGYSGHGFSSPCGFDGGFSGGFDGGCGSGGGGGDGGC